VHDLTDKAPRFIVSQADIKQRENSWINLPVLYGDGTFGYEMDGMALTWFSGSDRLGFGYSAAVTVNRTEYMQAVARLTQDRPTVKIVPLHRRSDFRTTVISLPASRPTVAGLSVETAVGPLITGQSGMTTEIPAGVGLPAHTET
jgi:hypothetical protein